MSTDATGFAITRCSPATVVARILSIAGPDSELELVDDP
jgi:hypothetical protein